MTGICVYYRITEILQCIAVSCYSVIYYSLQNMTEILQCITSIVSEYCISVDERF